ncbi:MAG: cardiolipin synthase [Rhodoferax sp.]|nr:cardiolipin synthase [Rhodoferax sp.]
MIQPSVSALDALESTNDLPDLASLENRGNRGTARSAAADSHPRQSSFHGTPGQGSRDADRQSTGGRWVGGNAFELLENGEAFFPRVFDAIRNAQREVVLETFILFEDKVGLALHEALMTAARRGVQIDMTIDGFGSPDLSPQFIGSLCEAGVRIHVFDPGARLFGWRTNMLRRMHRKIVVVDGEVAFVGGINYSADHLADFGPEAKQDYSVQVRGPIVAVIHRFVHAMLATGQRHRPGRRWFSHRARMRSQSSTAPPVGDAQALFVTRDNTEHTNDIERHYRAAIRSARQRVTIANAYFFPGYRLIRELRRAARRGVEVRLILQGQPDMPIVKTAAGLLYHHLINAGVQIFEYCERPLHGKVALVDDQWATVGSSNLDPLSLSLNLEANLIIRDRAFNAHLAERLEDLIANKCREISADALEPASGWRVARSFIVFHLLRHYPSWAGWLPAHAPKLVAAAASTSAAPAASTATATAVAGAGGNADTTTEGGTNVTAGGTAGGKKGGESDGNNGANASQCVLRITEAEG